MSSKHKQLICLFSILFHSAEHVKTHHVLLIILHSIYRNFKHLIFVICRHSLTLLYWKLQSLNANINL